MSHLAPIKTAPVRERVLQAIRDAIFAGRYSPGDPLRELHLARELGVSQAPVREALVRLEHLGLVVRVPNTGTHVTRLTARQVQERLRLRRMLEAVAFQDAAARMTEADFAGLDDRLDALAHAIRENRYFDAAQADLDVHRHVWRCADDATLYDVLDRLTVPLFAFVSLKRMGEAQRLAEQTASHEVLVAALRAGDPDAIASALDEHLDLLAAAPPSAR